MGLAGNRRIQKRFHYGFWGTLGKALILEGEFYERARDTSRNQKIALTIVILAAVSHALGSTVILLINRVSVLALLIALVLDAIAIIGGYYFWTFTIFKIGQWLKTNAVTYSELKVPIGFAYAPQVLNFLTLIPMLGRPIELGLSVWSLLTVIVAVRQGLDISQRRAIMICLVGWPLTQFAIGSVQLLEQWIANRL